MSRESGVDIYHGSETLPASDPAPWYLPHMAGARRVQSQLPGVDPKLYASYEYSTPIVDMAVYLPWLLRLFRRLGGHVRRRRVASLDELAPHCELAVNCAGLGARWLVPDPAVRPLIGVIVRAQPLPESATSSPSSTSSTSSSSSSISSAFTSTSASSTASDANHLSAAASASLRLPAELRASERPFGHHFHRISFLDGEVAYIYPRRDFVVLGGTYLPFECPTPDAWRRAMDADTQARHRDAILARCEVLEPRLRRRSRVLDVRWGARPYRPEVRCELELRPAAQGNSKPLPIVHNYGATFH